MQYLFVCAIGPVQDFIFTARRSRDLWYGSWMLSELSKAAARALAKYGLENLIFPAPMKANALLPGSELNVANKIVAVVPDDPVSVVTLVEGAIKTRLDELRDDAFCREHVRGEFNREIAERQLHDLVEYYWVGVPLNNVEEYADARKTADALLDARKTTRNFAQFNGLPVPKSSLDGARESVIPEEAYPTRRDNEQQRVAKISQLYQRYGARRGERLSGVDMVKRQGQRGDSAERRFKSTSDIAARPFLAAVERLKGTGKAQELLKEVKALLSEQDIHPEDRDGSLLYESRLREWVPDEVKFDGLRKKLTDKLEEYSGRQSVPPYYSLLMADGDNMGKIIDGQKSPERHRQLSQALSNFALEADRIVGNHKGVLVYAGGDDVLAYLPLHQALACAKTLAATFADRLDRFKATENGARPTLSVGLIVAHHLDPLADALELARDAEKTAKGWPTKDALAITVSKRSGVDRTIVGDRIALHGRLEDMISLLRQDAISKGVAYELQELHRVLGRTAGLPEDAVSQEALRVVKRKRESGGDKKTSAKVIGQFEQWLKTDKVPLDELASELIVAAIFADAANLADGSPEPKKQEVTS